MISPRFDNECPHSRLRDETDVGARAELRSHAHRYNTVLRICGFLYRSARLRGHSPPSNSVQTWTLDLDFSVLKSN